MAIQVVATTSDHYETSDYTIHPAPKIYNVQLCRLHPSTTPDFIRIMPRPFLSSSLRALQQLQLRSFYRRHRRSRYVTPIIGFSKDEARTVSRIKPFLTSEQCIETLPINKSSG
jgi:hypothetical protein